MNKPDEMPEPENFDAVTAYLPLLKDGAILEGKQELIQKTGTCGAITDFLKVLYYNNWMMNAKWQEWTGIAETHLGHNELLDEADVETIRKILTVHTRIDRLFPGDIADIINKGYMYKIVTRIGQLKEEVYPDLRR